jgi:streptogramin lyase
MRLLTSTAVLLLALGAAVLSAPLAAGAKPRLLSSPGVEVGARWVGTLVAPRRPFVRAWLGRRAQAVAVSPLRPGRYRLRAVFPAPGRWTLWAGRARLGTVLVRPRALRLTNTVDVVAEPGGAVLVADLSNRVFLLNGSRLTLVAGNGRAGRSGDGGPATGAAIGFPVEVALAPEGGFAIVHGERWVRHVDAVGTIRTVGEFAQPTALAYDAAGNLWVSELDDRVLRVAPDGARTTYTGFDAPHGLAAAADGSVYVADTFGNRIRRIAPDGTVATHAEGLNQPNDVALGPDGAVFAAVYGDNAIVRIGMGGAATRVAEATGPSAVAVGADGTVYFTERGRPGIRRAGAFRLAALKPARAGTPWTGVVAARRRPTVTARNGVTTQPVSVRRAGKGRYRLRAVFPFSGRWQLLVGRRRLATVTVRPAAPLRSTLPCADAFALCAGTGPPYPQYALSWDPAGGLWAACRQQARLHRIDLASGETRAILRLTSGAPYSIAAGLGAVWSAERSPNVNRLDLRTGRATTAIAGHSIAYVWTAAGSVWAADDQESLLVRYDPSAGRIVATIPTGIGTSALHEEGDRIWILNHRDGTLERVDPATNTATILGRLPGDARERITYAEGSLWVTGRGTDLLRVDTETGGVQASIEIGAGGIDVRAAAHSIWVAAASDAEDRQGNPVLERLLRVDPQTNAVTETLRPTARLVVNGMVSTGNALWLADTAGGRLFRVSR